MSLIVENSLLVYLILSCLLGGGTAFLTGRALALGWRSLAHLVMATLIIAFALRFLHFALFEGNLLSLHYALSDTATLAVFSALGYRATRTKQMVTNYHWLYKRTSALTWSDR